MARSPIVAGPHLLVLMRRLHEHFKRAHGERFEGSQDAPVCRVRDVPQDKYTTISHPEGWGLRPSLLECKGCFVASA